MLKRKEVQSRYQCSVTGVTNETCFSDLAKEGKDGVWIRFDPEDPNWEEPYIKIEIDCDGFVPPENPMYVRVRYVLDQLPERSQETVFCFLEGMTQRDAAKTLGISQSTYHERLHGRNGVGGIFNHLREMIEAMPPIVCS